MSIKFKPTQIAMPQSPNYGKWYAKMVPTGTITSKQLAEEVSHASTVTQSDMLAVLWSIAEVASAPAPRTAPTTWWPTTYTACAS